MIIRSKMEKEQRQTIAVVASREEIQKMRLKNILEK